MRWWGEFETGTSERAAVSDRECDLKRKRRRLWERAMKSLTYSLAAGRIDGGLYYPPCFTEHALGLVITVTGRLPPLRGP